MPHTHEYAGNKETNIDIATTGNLHTHQSPDGKVSEAPFGAGHTHQVGGIETGPPIEVNDGKTETDQEEGDGAEALPVEL